MSSISRRQFLSASASLTISSFLFPAALVAMEKNQQKGVVFPATCAVLQNAYVSEMTAHRHYEAFAGKAVEQKYVNIAYMFKAFGVSEKIHADNYKRILTALGVDPGALQNDISVFDTKANLAKATERELIKIEKTYPEFLEKLKKESHGESINHCLYSWKSHKQHEKTIHDLRRYSRLFFGSVARRIERMEFDFHVCKNCGSTIEEPAGGSVHYL